MRSSSSWRRVAVGIGASCLLAPMVNAQAAGATPVDPSTFTARQLHVVSKVSAPKSDSGRRAVSDQALLKRSDSTPVNVVVKLDYDATASYQGGLRGLPATSPTVTGRRLTGHSPAEVAYDRYTAGLDRSFRAALAAHIPSARAGQSLQDVYGGVAVTVPANQVKNLLAIKGVAAVQSDSLQHPDATTVEGPQFIGAPTIWARTGGQSLAGRGVIFADLDTGLWPEHPMLADNPALGTPPPAPSGKARPCNFGDNPLTAATDVFVCNHKVIGGAPSLKTYNHLVGGEVYPDSARDSNGHGTHTTTTAAGDAVTSAPIFGVERGPISGVAPGAWVLEYKVCGLQGCFSSDSAAAVQQAILDGANVINYSISGGSNPFSDPVELAFLDAYNAGVLVSASAGNSGPGAGTTDHHSPWVTTVAASTQSRAFQSTLTVSDAGQSATFVGTSLTDGVSTPTPIVLAQDIPGYDKRCSTPLAAGAATGKIVACQRGVIGRVQKGFNVLQGGAVGMILYNLPLADTESDNHFLPTVHLADGTAFLAFMAAHPNATGSFTAGQKVNGQGDVMAAFSSRGPGGQFLKPDITAPGVQVLAGNTPTPDDIAAGPAGQYYQAIAGTSMSAPHIAGSAILVKALHPSWTPGAIKSALMTTATTKVVKEDLTTPADPFDMGAGRVDLTKAGSAPIVFDETADNMVTLGANPLTAINLNEPSVNLPIMPGTVTVTRTATNVSGRSYEFHVSTKAPAGSRIRVSPSEGTIRAGRSQTFRITVSSDAASGQYFGEIDIHGSFGPALHLPVAFFDKQGDVSLAQSCSPAGVSVRASTTCTVKIQNDTGTGDATVTAQSTVSEGLKITGSTGATVNRSGTSASAGPVTLVAPKDAIPAIATGGTPAGGFLNLLALSGVTPNPIGDDQAANFDVPAFDFGGKTYTQIGVVSNGYLVLGGADAADVVAAPQHFPDPARPNGVLAPYWTDLDGNGSPGISAAVLSGGASSWLVIQWDVHIFGQATEGRSMQVWIGLNGTEDISYAYAASTIGATAPSPGLTVGVENASGTSGVQIADAAPTGSYVVTTTPGQPGGSLTYTLTVRGLDRGARSLTSVMNSDIVAGETRVRTPITVTR